MEFDRQTPVLILKTRWDAIQYSSLAVVRSLGRVGVPVYAVCEDRFTPTMMSRYLAGAYIWRQGGLNQEMMIDDLRTIGGDMRCRAILLPMDDLGAVLVAENAHDLKRWFMFPQCSSDIARMLADKGSLASLCHKVNQPHPRTVTIRSRLDLGPTLAANRYPLVFKRPQQWVGVGPTTQLVDSAEQLVALCRHAEEHGFEFLLQDYIPATDRQDWFFHAYCDAQFDCLASFTGLKVRSGPPRAGATSLGESIDNPELRRQAEAFLKTIQYTGLVDMDYRFDSRDGSYNLLDCNPRLGAQFRVFQDERGIDLVRALHLDLTGRRPSYQVRSTKRRFIVEDRDMRSCVRSFLAREISASEWARSLRNIDEKAWLASDDLLPVMMLLVRRAIGFPRHVERRRPPVHVAGRFAKKLVSHSNRGVAQHDIVVPTTNNSSAH
jgi:D-aspartate ligase